MSKLRLRPSLLSKQDKERNGVEYPAEHHHRPAPHSMDAGGQQGGSYGEAAHDEPNRVEEVEDRDERGCVCIVIGGGIADASDICTMDTEFVSTHC